MRVAAVDGSLAPAVSVYDPTGTATASSGSSAGVASVSFTAGKAGVYTVIVAAASSGTSTGAYNLYFTIAPGANENGAIVPGVVVDGQIAEGELESYTFVANAGDMASVRVTATGGTVAPGVIVYDPTGTPKASSGSSAGLASVGFTAVNTGTYTVVVSDVSGGLASTGTYTISLTIVPASN